LRKLAALTRVEDLDKFKERKDKLISKLYVKKLELLLEDENNSLFRCIYCNKLFTRGQKPWMVCSKANIFIDFHGRVIAEHVADRSWDTNKFIHYLRQQCALSWREIYWKIWARLHTLHCAVCDRRFVVAEFGHCSYHAQKPRFGSGSNRGMYPCCNAPAIRFDTALKTYGCQAANHQPSMRATAEEVAILDCVLARMHIVAEPFLSEHNYAEQFARLESAMALSNRNSQKNSKAEVDAVPLDLIKDSPSLHVLMAKYVAHFGESCYSVSEGEEDEDPPSPQTPQTLPTRSSTDSTRPPGAPSVLPVPSCSKAS
jgi:hypothetical protein